MLIIAFFLAACSAKGVTTDSETTTTTETTTATDGTTETGSVMCVLPKDEALSGASATIVIRNESSEVRYVQPPSQFASFTIEIEGKNVLWDSEDTFGNRCNSYQCDWGFSDGDGRGLILPPGASYEFTWNGGVWRDEAIDESCEAELNCTNKPTFCEVRRPSGDVEYKVSVALAETCPLDQQETCDACTEGACEINIYEPGGLPVWKTVEASGTFPGGVEIVLQ